MALDRGSIGARGGVRHDKSGPFGSGKGCVRGKDLPEASSSTSLDDGYLIALAKQGNADAYDRLVRRYYSFVRLKASSYFLIGGDSDDLIQEGLVGLYKAIRDFRTDRESLVPQLRGALHHAPDHHRGQDRDAQQAHAAERLRLVLGHAGGRDATPSRRSTRCCPARPRGTRSTRSSPPRSCARWSPACRTVLSDLESRVLSLYLDGYSYTVIGEKHRLRLQDRRQRAPAREAQGRRASRLARGARLDPQSLT